MRPVDRSLRDRTPTPALLLLPLLALLAGACGQVAPRLSVTFTPEAIPADGKATARVTVNLEGHDGQILLSTSRGTFQDSGAERTVLSVVSGQATAVLLACDEAADPACPGNASVVATASMPDGEEIGFGIITFVGSGGG